MHSNKAHTEEGCKAETSENAIPDAGKIVKNIE